MKTLILLSNRIRRYFIKNRSIFLLFIIGGVINAIVFAYLYGNLLPAVANRNSQEIYYREYSVYLSDDEKTDIPLDEMQKSGLFESVIPGYVEYIPFSGESISVFSVFSGEPPVVIENGSSKLYECGQIIIPYTEAAGIGDTVELYGKSFTVVGRHTWKEYYILYDDFCDIVPETNNIYAISAEHYSPSDDKAAEKLSSLFPGSDLKTPKLASLSDRNRSRDELFMICVCYAVSAISFMFLLRYMVDSVMDENIVSIIVGAPKITVALMIFWEGALLSSIASVIGLVMHRLLTPSLFSKINVSEGLVYSLTDYLIVFLIIFVITVLILIPFVAKYAKLSPASAKRESF